jgi:microcystin-dependent protein
MGQPFIGEIRLFAGHFAPAGWAFCDGSLLAIAENETLFQLIGTTYGGDGESTFALPDLRGRIPIHAGSGPGLTPRVLAESDGTENVTLTTPQMPPHAHAWQATSAPADPAAGPVGALLAHSSPPVYVAAPVADVSLAPQLVGAAGGSQPHENMAPYLCVSFIISLYGIFPSPT